MAVPLRYNILSLWSRPTSTLSSVLLVGVVIAVFTYLQALTDSAFNTMVASGHPHTVIVLNQAAESETVSGLAKDEINLLEVAPGAERDDRSTLISPELVAIGSAFTHDGSEVKINTAVRGVNFDRAAAVRHNEVRLLEGRLFNPGTEEVIVGQAARRLYRDHELGDEIQLGTRGMRRFKIVGIFDAGGTASDSEIWGYVETFREVFGRQRYSSARMRVADDSAARRLIEYVEGPSVGLTAKTEREYFQDLNLNQSATQILGIFMIVIMGIAAAFAVANTMYAAVAGRTNEIGMLRAIGYGRSSILAAFYVEGLILTLAGGVLGSLVSFLYDGMQQNMLPTTFTTVSYSLAVTPKIIGTSLLAAVAIGLLGSLAPAWRAAKLDVVNALREP